MSDRITPAERVLLEATWEPVDDAICHAAAKWGDACALRLTPHEALPVLVAEVGEVAAELRVRHYDPERLHDELAQVAAVATMMLARVIADAS